MPWGKGREGQAVPGGTNCNVRHLYHPVQSSTNRTSQEAMALRMEQLLAWQTPTVQGREQGNRVAQRHKGL